MPIKVNEIFSSLQGESSWTGYPSSFVRLTGCNLRCAYCDTQYAYEQGETLTISDIVQHLHALQCRRICITGGEPLLQVDTPALIGQLLDNGYRVGLETNGSLDIRGIDNRCMIVLDMKCPSSGMQHRNYLENLKHLGPDDQIKFVIANREDYQFACDVVQTSHYQLPGDGILFSPVSEHMPAQQLAQWILDDRIEVRLQIQLHKYLWPPQERCR